MPQSQEQIHIACARRANCSCNDDGNAVRARHAHCQADRFHLWSPGNKGERAFDVFTAAIFTVFLRISFSQVFLTNTHANLAIPA
ncbi:hypothetical protein CTI10_012760 [Delftia acidovorans]|nr:hypothetical protein CTI10_012760 [Delftia acidovorans]